MNYTFDEESNAWYFHLDQTPGDKFTHVVTDLGTRRVMIDWDENGNVIGVEVL